MRQVRLSITFNDQLNVLLAQVEDRYGAALVEEKKQKVYATIRNFLARHPGVKRRHKRLTLVVYPITDTPFVVLYDFDRKELRVHFIFRGNDPLRDLDPTSAEW